MQSISFGGVVISGSRSNYVATGNSGSHNTIENNVISGGYFGVSLAGASVSSPNVNNIVTANEIKNFRALGITARYQEDLAIEGNTLHQTDRINDSWPTAIELTFSNPGARLARNRIYNVGGPANLGTADIISMRAAVGTNTKKIRIENNLIYNVRSSVTQHAIHFFQNQCNHIEIFHNTFLLGNPSLTPVSPHKALNAATFISNVNVKNNIFWFHNDAIYYSFMAAVVSFQSDYNVFHKTTNSSNFRVFFQGVSILTLTQWQNLPTGGFDGNSVLGDPVFIDPAGGDLSPLFPIANNNGVGLGVTEDFFGTPRSAERPDRGAIEHNSAEHDLALLEFYVQRNSCLSNAKPLAFLLYKMIGANSNFANDSIVLEWNVNGPISSSGTFVVDSGTMSIGDTMLVLGGFVDVSEPGLYTLSAWIQPSFQNGYSFNDTIADVTLSVSPIFEASPKTIFLSSNTATASATITSRFLGIPEAIHFTEIYQGPLLTNHAPTNGWPSYMQQANSYVELTGPPNFDISGWTLEQWYQLGNSNVKAEYTFGSGTVFSPNGTLVVAVSYSPNSTESPANFYYHGFGNMIFSFSASTPVGRVLRAPNGILADAVSFRGYVFPPNSGVTDDDWIDHLGFVPPAGTSGMRLLGGDVNSPTHWSYVQPTNRQDPNLVNQGVIVPLQPNYNFQWTLNGTLIDTTRVLTVGPFAVDGRYVFVASMQSPCGLLVDSVIVHVGVTSAKVQFINDISDAFASSVAVWVNDSKVVSQLNYRSASAFLPIAAETPMVLSITLVNASDTVGALYQKTVTFTNTKSHIAVANGVFSFAGYSVPTPVDWHIYTEGREQSTSVGETDMLFFHGASDAPIAFDIDKRLTGTSNVVSNLQFLHFAGYTSIFPENYELVLRTLDGSDYIAYLLPLLDLGLKDEAITLLISGFVDPTGNNNGPGFGLWLAQSSGGNLIPLDRINGISVEEVVNLHPLVSVFPNPASHRLQLNFHEPVSGAVYLEWVNSIGAVVMTNRISLSNQTTHVIDVQSLPVGFYFLRIFNNDDLELKKVQVLR
ncbi:MAG: T9SS type A sorting domain-containing protein [Oceanicaulis sp.]|nr:T9SS type A sorting domain-containing protein [Oceanicaulis sp.]